MSKKVFLFCFLLLVSISVIGCGGGGGSSSNTAQKVSLSVKIADPSPTANIRASKDSKITVQAFDLKNNSVGAAVEATYDETNKVFLATIPGLEKSQDLIVKALENSTPCYTALLPVSKIVPNVDLSVNRESTAQKAIYESWAKSTTQQVKNMDVFVKAIASVLGTQTAEDYLDDQGVDFKFILSGSFEASIISDITGQIDTKVEEEANQGGNETNGITLPSDYTKVTLDMLKKAKWGEALRISSTEECANFAKGLIGEDTGKAAKLLFSAEKIDNLTKDFIKKITPEYVAMFKGYPGSSTQPNDTIETTQPGCSFYSLSKEDNTYVINYAVAVHRWTEIIKNSVGEVLDTRTGQKAGKYEHWLRMWSTNGRAVFSLHHFPESDNSGVGEDYMAHGSLFIHTGENGAKYIKFTPEDMTSGGQPIEESSCYYVITTNPIDKERIGKLYNIADHVYNAPNYGGVPIGTPYVEDQPVVVQQ